MTESLDRARDLIRKVKREGRRKTRTRVQSLPGIVRRVQRREKYLRETGRI